MVVRFHPEAYHILSINSYTHKGVRGVHKIKDLRSRDPLFQRASLYYVVERLGIRATAVTESPLSRGSKISEISSNPAEAGALAPSKGRSVCAKKAPRRTRSVEDLGLSGQTSSNPFRETKFQVSRAEPLEERLGGGPKTPKVFSARRSLGAGGSALHMGNIKTHKRKTCPDRFWKNLFYKFFVYQRRDRWLSPVKSTLL